jgi:hypothetical protein
VCIYLCMYVYVQIYVYICLYTHTTFYNIRKLVYTVYFGVPYFGIQY